jgi:4-hydroxy-tetrahydrodipicolinate synthase
MKRKFEGIFPALVTPMTPGGEVDLDAMTALIESLITDGGVHGVIPLGSTGEFYALSDEEREAVVKTTIAASAGRVPVLVGTNDSSTSRVVEHSKQAESLGADGLLLAAPYYSLPTHDELFEHFRAVNDAVGIPIMLYNYPGRTGVDMTPDLIERLADLENVQYVKESSGDVTRVSEIIRRCGDKVSVFCGCDCLAMESFVLGAIGWVGGIVNFLPQEHVQLFELAVREGDLLKARAHYYRLLPILSHIENSGTYTQLVKAGCELAGHVVGAPRAPLQAVAEKERDQLRAMFSDLRQI